MGCFDESDNNASFMKPSIFLLQFFPHLHTRTDTPTVFPTVYYSCRLVISSYHKLYQKYFDILLNYKILKLFCYQKKKDK